MEWMGSLGQGPSLLMTQKYFTKTSYPDLVACGVGRNPSDTGSETQAPGRYEGNNVEQRRDPALKARS
jgi:hypothetical protein